MVIYSFTHVEHAFTLNITFLKLQHHFLKLAKGGMPVTSPWCPSPFPSSVYIYTLKFCEYFSIHARYQWDEPERALNSVKDVCNTSVFTSIKTGSRFASIHINSYNFSAKFWLFNSLARNSSYTLNFSLFNFLIHYEYFAYYLILFDVYGNHFFLHHQSSC